MMTTALISFREFLEAFLIVGVFLGISRNIKIRKETEIMAAAIAGIIISLLMAVAVYAFGDQARGILTEKNAELLESYLMIFSGFFLAYVVYSLHGLIHRSHAGVLIDAHKKLAKNVFDVSLFMTIVFLVVREGFEIALFTASTSLFSDFMQNFVGLMAGFGGAIVFGLGTFLAYIKFPVRKVFRITEYMIVILGAALVQNGLTEFFEHGLNIELDEIISLPLKFLPAKSTLVGHFISSFTGLDRNMSLARLAIMAGYIGIVYLLFRKRRLKNANV